MVEILLLSFNFKSKGTINRVIRYAIVNAVMWQKLFRVKRKKIEHDYCWL